MCYKLNETILIAVIRFVLNYFLIECVEYLMWESSLIILSLLPMEYRFNASNALFSRRN